MKEVFKRWEQAKEYSSPISSPEGDLLFKFIISEYYKQDEEKNTGVTKLNCCKLYKLLGMKDFELNDPFIDEFEHIYDGLSTDILKELDSFGVIFFLLNASITKPYYTVSISPVINGLIESTGLKLIKT